MSIKKPSDLILPFHTLGTLKQRIGWFINLRWVAVIIILSTIPIADNILKLNFGYSQLYKISVIITILNIAYLLIYKYYPFKRFRQELSFTEIQIIIDFIIISFWIHYIGGISNPFFFLYLVHIVISGILFYGILPYINAFIAAFLLTGWSLLEFNGIVETYPFRSGPTTFPVLIISLFAFYILSFATTYIISDFMRRYRSLKRIIDEKSELLEKTIVERDKMFRFTAHELKSPLTTLRSLLSAINSLYSEGKKEEVMDMIKRAERRADQVLFMVKDMIDITQYKQGKKKKVCEIVEYENWIRKVIGRLKDYANTKGINIYLKPMTTEKMVCIDIPSFEKVIENLVSNAIKYNKPGGEVNVEPFVKDNSYGVIVQDTGIGIPEDELSEIFKEFYRSKEARKKELLGTGLGLTLVKQIVDQFGGKITVESEVGKGSIFTIEMPFIINSFN